MRRLWIGGVVAALIVCSASVSRAQLLTTGTITGTVKDSSGGVLPGVTIALTSETKGTPVPPVVSEANGEFLVPNLAPDTYRLEITLQGFKTLQRGGLPGTGADPRKLAAPT